MRTDGIGSTIDIAVSGLRAQATKMDVVAANIANVNTSRTDTDEPYRRRMVVFSTLLDGLKGVEVLQIAPDMKTEFNTVYQPGHPDADGDGFVTMPNIDLPTEMIDMVTASRAYGANAAILKRYQESMDVTLELLR